MDQMIRKTALTAYGKIGTDYVRQTAANVDGQYVFVRADGSNAVVPELSTEWRTSGDMVNVTAQLGHRVSMAAVPSVALPNHVWKQTFDLAGIAEKFGVPQLVEKLTASYSEAVEEAA